MNGWVDRWVDGCMKGERKVVGEMNGWMDGWVDGCMKGERKEGRDGWMDGVQRFTTN